MSPTEPEVSFPAASSGSRSSLFLAYFRQSNFRKALGLRGRPLSPLDVTFRFTLHHQLVRFPRVVVVDSHERKSLIQQA
jgi:hypothetical protein